LIETVTALQRRGVAFHSLTEQIDTATATGQLVFHIFGALAEFERNLIRERTLAGLQAARARGRNGGRPKLDPARSTVVMAKKLYADKTNAIRDICQTLHISRATLYRYLKAGA
jgi:DNA invertase Pin-like site-specific DNA recombinase